MAGSTTRTKKDAATTPPSEGASVNVEKAANVVWKRRVSPSHEPGHQTGPRSLAGFSPAWVNGATRQMIELTVNPIKTGAKASSGRPTLHPSVSAKIISTYRNVPNASAPIAKGKVYGQGHTDPPSQPTCGTFDMADTEAKNLFRKRP